MIYLKRFNENTDGYKLYYNNRNDYNKYRENLKKLKVSDNVDILNIVGEITKKLNLKIIGYLGSGARGKAFVCEDNKVVKVTSDKEEVSFYLNLNSPKYIVNTYGIYKLNSPSINESYVIVMDRLDSLSKYESGIIMNCYITFYYIDSLCLENPENWILEELDGWIDENKYTNKDIVRNIVLKYSRIITELKSIGANEDECHIDNIGVDKNGVYKCFDITSKVDISKINNLPVLNIW
jgi:hypothetical protein